MTHFWNDTRRSRINRRAFLRGAGTVAVGLPFLESLPDRSAWAQSQTPVFGLFIITSCGVVQKSGSDPEKFWPTEVGPLTTAGMAAMTDRATGILADHADKLLIVRGVDYPYGNSGCGHSNGLVQSLTAQKPTGTNQNATSTGISIDQRIATDLNPPGVDPLTLYAGIKGGYIHEKLSFSAAGKVRAAESNPYNVYQDLVGLIKPPSTGSGGSGGSGNGMAERLALRRQSINDVVRAELNSITNSSRISAEDKRRLDQHFTAIRDVENGMMGMGLQCSAEGLEVDAITAMNNGSAFRQDGMQEEVAKLQMDLVGLAFSCNATRVATLQVGDGTDGTRYTIDGQKVERFHYISHRIQSDGTSGAAIPKAVEWHTAIDRIRMGTFKYLLDKWANYATGTGPLLDNAFAMWSSHIAVGPSHSYRNLPYIIAGSAGGFLKQGAYVDAGGAKSNKLLNTLAAAMGVKNGSAPIDNFGGSELEGGHIPEMLATS
jgi:hypothetical protein